MIYYYVQHWSDFVALELWYRKLVETFHFGNECNTAVYFSWCLIQVLAQPVQLFWPLVTFSIASGNSLTYLDLQLFIETEQDIHLYNNDTIFNKKIDQNNNQDIFYWIRCKIFAKELVSIFININTIGLTSKSMKSQPNTHSWFRILSKRLHDLLSRIIFIVKLK